MTWRHIEQPRVNEHSEPLPKKKLKKEAAEEAYHGRPFSNNVLRLNIRPRRRKRPQPAKRSTSAAEKSG